MECPPSPIPTRPSFCSPGRHPYRSPTGVDAFSDRCVALRTDRALRLFYVSLNRAGRSGVVHHVQIQGEPAAKMSFSERVPSTFTTLFREDYAKSVRLAHLLTGSNP